MRDGQFEQIGTPAEVYDWLPKTSYVASFAGTANLIAGVLEDTGSDGMDPYRGWSGTGIPAGTSECGCGAEGQQCGANIGAPRM